MGVRVEPSRLVAPWLRPVGPKHRRTRMINASFLVRHLPMRWRSRTDGVGSMRAGAVLAPAPSLVRQGAR